ncbi:MAG: hypothetical protein BME94_02260 [Methanobacteriales archaeon Met13]
MRLTRIFKTYHNFSFNSLTKKCYFILILKISKKNKRKIKAILYLYVVHKLLLKVDGSSMD